MEIQGRVKKLMPIVEGTSAIGNHYRRLEFIFEFFGKPSDVFSQTLVFTVMNDKIDEYNLVEGEEVIVDMEMKVRPYNNKLYNDIYARNIKKVKVDEPAVEQKQEQLTLEQQAAMEKLKQMGEQAATGDENGSKDDGMPF